MAAAELGVHSDLASWMQLNIIGATSDEQSRLIAPFPPPFLMFNSTACKTNEEFASHGIEVFTALARASPKPLGSFEKWLDFGVGVGRLARMFLGYRGTYAGVDVDPDAIEWISANLPWLTPVLSQPSQPLPLQDSSFDAVVSISVFTHMSGRDQDFYLAELQRVTQPGAMLFLTVCGERVLSRAENEEQLRDMMVISQRSLRKARKNFDSGEGFFFEAQQGHLTTKHYKYGNTFVNASYIMREWSRFFKVIAIWSGAIHDFQDIVVLLRR
jgi:ubiquinone/menaquinone biosynthesis C-methylase UbiE